MGSGSVGVDVRDNESECSSCNFCVLIVTDAPFRVYFQVVIIRYDKMARDHGIVHMTVTRAYIITCSHVTVG